MPKNSQLDWKLSSMFISWSLIHLNVFQFYICSRTSWWHHPKNLHLKPQRIFPPCIWLLSSIIEVDKVAFSPSSRFPFIISFVNTDKHWIVTILQQHETEGNLAVIWESRYLSRPLHCFPQLTHTHTHSLCLMGEG